ncbi:MAG: hypothetical protein QXU95_03410 [Candidatus Bathyarchaeia archaeon]
MVILPESFSFLAILGLFLTAIMEIRQGHIGRIDIALNVFLLWQIYYPKWAMLSELFQWYLNISTPFAIVAILSYLIEESLPTEFYRFALILYGSLTILFIIIFLDMAFRAIYIPT